jgi:antitoxin component of MazEF toxin-antitoxin module
MRFHTTILKSGETATGFRVPDDVVEALGAGRRPKVRVTINGFTYRSSIATVDGSPMVGVSAENRAGAGVQGGDEVDVDIEVDTAPREVRVPRELAEALDAEPAARTTFDALSYSNKSWHAIQIESAKTDETRRRRLEKSIEALKQGKPR